METKTLRLEGAPGKIENQYALNILVPGKLDLLTAIERPPFHIFSKNDTTYSTGILSRVPHSVKLRISRDYQEPFVGIYIKITPSADEIIDISEVKGTFTIAPTPESRSTTGTHVMLSSRSQSVTNPIPNQSDERNHPFLNHGYHPVPFNINHSGAKDVPSVFSFSFFKNSVSKLTELDSYDYYESRCHWPDVPSQMDVLIKVTKTTYSVLVNDDTALIASSAETKSSVSSLPYFLSDTYSDVTIQVGEEVFPAHKIILSERSNFFSRMFSNSMRESNEGIVRIGDEDESLFREILRFIYQGMVENFDENATDLYVLADKYDIPELITLCEKFLLDHLSVENAMEMFDLSQTVTSQGILAKKSKELIMWNKDKFATDLQSFKDFSRKYPEVIFELLQL